MDAFNFAAAAAWLLGAFFGVGAVINWIAPKVIRDEYARWGYPGWFHYLTAVLELAAAALLFFETTRLPGAFIGAVVMAAAAMTLIRHREFGHAIVPVVVFALTVWVAAS